MWQRALLGLVGLSIVIAIPTTTRAADRIGVVWMHGTEWTPKMGDFGDVLRAAGYVVESPEMCWSHRRKHDRPYLQCLAELDQAVSRLRARGATAIVIAGQSQGGNAAIGYGAGRSELKGIIAIGPPPTAGARQSPMPKGVEDAKRLIAEGKGNTPQIFMFSNDTGPFRLTATPNIFVSFYAPDSPAHMGKNAARLKVPLLIVFGDRDPLLEVGRSLAFFNAPPHKLNRFVIVAAGHRDAPRASRQTILSWLRELAGN